MFLEFDFSKQRRYVEKSLNPIENNFNFVIHSDPGRFEFTKLHPALERCTHLIFSGAQLLNYRVIIPDDSVPRQLFHLRWNFYPHLKILLGIGRKNANLLDDFHSGYLRVVGKFITIKFLIHLVFRFY